MKTLAWKWQLLLAAATCTVAAHGPVDAQILLGDGQGLYAHLPPALPQGGAHIIQPDQLHQRVPVFLGSRNEVEEATRYHREHDSAAG